MRIALIIPACFDGRIPFHLEEARLALDLLRQNGLSGKTTIFSLSPDASPVFTGMDYIALGCQLSDDTLCSAPLLEQFDYAFCLLDKRIAEHCSTHVPTRLLGRDTLYFLNEKWRVAFQDMQAIDAYLCRHATPVLPDPAQPIKAVVYIDHFFPLSHARALVLKGHLAPASRIMVSRYISPQIIGQFKDWMGPDYQITIIEHGCGTYEWAQQWSVPHSLNFPHPVLRQSLPILTTDVALLKIFAEQPHHAVGTVSAGCIYYWSPCGGVYLINGHASTLKREQVFLYKGEDYGIQDRLKRHALSQDNQSPLISVIVPVYDRQDEVRRLARSIINQEYRGLEVVFVSNGSPQGTQTVLQEVVARLNENRIAAQTIIFEQAFGCATIPRDVGAFASRGDFLCFMDSDDYLEPGFFNYFKYRRLKASVIYYPKKIFRNHGRRMPDDFRYERVVKGYGQVAHELFWMLMERGNVFCNSGMVVSKAWFMAAKGIRHDLRYCEDYYLWLRLARMGAHAVEHRGCVSISLHPHNNELSVQDNRWIYQAQKAALEGIVI